MPESDDEVPMLCPETLKALQEFYKEQQERTEYLNRISEQTTISDVTFDENWQLSQFWYDDETTENLVKGAINSTPPDGNIALISCPTLYNPLRKNCGDRRITLLEFDERFKVHGPDFIPYDYKSPLDVPIDLASSYDLVIADPPFLSDECLTKTAITIKFLTKMNVVLCTGVVMESLAERLLDVKRCSFIPRHKNNLANEFYCYANFDFDNALK